MITKDKGIEIFCIIDEFDKNLSEELSKNLRLPSVGKDGIRHRNRPGRLSESEIMTILVYYHFGTLPFRHVPHLQGLLPVLHQGEHEGLLPGCRLIQPLRRAYAKGVPVDDAFHEAARLREM